MITTEYAGNYIYEVGVLQFFNTAKGYVGPKGTGWEYVFQYKDHLGNIRLSYADADGNGLIAQTEIREENNYYPFGLKHKGYNSTLTGKDHKYGFGSKEEQDELGLGWIDITARNYDPALGRWMNVDPLAELMRRHSPYNYAFDNPIYFIDADGMMPKPSDPPVKKIKESSQAGNINPVGVNSRGFFPSSTSSSVGVSVEVSIKQDDFGILSLVSPELTYSVSSEIKTVTSQFLDADGNSVSNIEDATSFAVTTNTKTTTIDVGVLGEISEQATITETNVSTTYDITKNSEGKLSNPVEIQNEPKISTIDSKTASSTLQNLAKDEANQNLSKISSTFSNGVKESVNSTEQHNQKVLKKF